MSEPAYQERVELGRAYAWWLERQISLQARIVWLEQAYSCENWPPAPTTEQPGLTVEDARLISSGRSNCWRCLGQRRTREFWCGPWRVVQPMPAIALDNGARVPHPTYARCEACDPSGSRHSNPNHKNDISWRGKELWLGRTDGPDGQAVLERAALLLEPRFLSELAPPDVLNFHRLVTQ